MKVENGSILIAEEDIIVHQVNCLGVMGGGLAAQILTKYPEVGKEYKKFCKKNQGNLLGQVQLVDTYYGKIVANLFGQEKIRQGRYDDKVYTDYPALEQALTTLRNKAEELNLTIAIPVNLGCGLANGDWSKVLDIIERVFKDFPNEVKLYHLP